MPDPIFFDNDSSINNIPNVGNTVIDGDNKYGVICDRNNDANNQCRRFVLSFNNEEA